MMNFNFKKVGLPIALVVVIILSSVVAVWTMKKTDAKKLEIDETEISTTELTTLVDEEPVTEIHTEIVEVVETSLKDNGEIITVKETEIETKIEIVANATEKKEKKTTAKATTEKQVKVETKETEATTKYVAPVTTTKKQESVTSSVVTTKAPKPTTTKPAPKPVETTKPAKPTTTKAPKDEYYPALTAADMKTLEAYCKQYVESKGYKYDSSLNWDNSGYGCTLGMNDNLSIYGDTHKIDGGVAPIEKFKTAIREDVDYYVDVFGYREWLSMVFLYERNGNSWRIAVGYMA